jgi:hypothetical protein
MVQGRRYGLALLGFGILCGAAAIGYWVLFEDIGELAWVALALAPAFLLTGTFLLVSPGNQPSHSDDFDEWFHSQSVRYRMIVYVISGVSIATATGLLLWKLVISKIAAEL